MELYTYTSVIRREMEIETFSCEKEKIKHRPNMDASPPCISLCTLAPRGARQFDQAESIDCEHVCTGESISS